MSESQLTDLSAAVGNQAVPANENFRACWPGGHFGLVAAPSALDVDIYGGIWKVAGVPSEIGRVTLSLDDDSTSYIRLNTATGAVTAVNAGDSPDPHPGWPANYSTYLALHDFTMAGGHRSADNDWHNDWRGSSLASSATPTGTGFAHVTVGVQDPAAMTAAAALAAVSPLTTKGDLLAFSTLNVRLGVGTDGQALVADSASTPGVKWATIGDPAAATHAASSKATPVDADEIPLADSAASFALKKLTWANLKTTVRTYFDTLYQALSSNLTTIDGLTATTDSFIQSKSSAWASRTIAQVQADLLNANLTTISGLTATNDSFVQAKSSAWAARTVAQVQADLQGTGSSATDCGYRGLPQNSQSAAYTTVMADNGRHIFHPAADTTARTWTIDSNANVAYPIGAAITFDNQFGAGALTIAITADMLELVGSAGTTGSRAIVSGGQATAIKVTSTRWRISGTGLS